MLYTRKKDNIKIIITYFIHILIILSILFSIFVMILVLLANGPKANKTVTTILLLTTLITFIMYILKRNIYYAIILLNTFILMLFAVDSPSKFTYQIGYIFILHIIQMCICTKKNIHYVHLHV